MVLLGKVISCDSFSAERRLNLVFSYLFSVLYWLYILRIYLVALKCGIEAGSGASIDPRCWLWGVLLELRNGRQLTPVYRYRRYVLKFLIASLQDVPFSYGTGVFQALR